MINIVVVSMASRYTIVKYTCFEIQKFAVYSNLEKQSISVSISPVISLAMSQRLMTGDLRASFNSVQDGGSGALEPKFFHLLIPCVKCF